MNVPIDMEDVYDAAHKEICVGCDHPNLCAGEGGTCGMYEKTVDEILAEWEEI